MGIDARLVCILLNKRPNGRNMRHSKPMRIPRSDAERLVDAGRASFMSKTSFKEMVKKVEIAKASSKGTKKKSRKKRGWKKEKKSD